MTDKELEVKLAEINVRAAKLQVRESKIDMDEGFKRMKAKMEAEYEGYKSMYEGALLNLEEQELHLKYAKDKEEKNFD